MNDKMTLTNEVAVEMAYVKISKIRTKVLKTLYDDVKMPVQISKDTDILMNRVSVTLRQLREHDLVVCLNPDARKGRLYRLTETGVQVAEYLMEN